MKKAIETFLEIILVGLFILGFVKMFLANRFESADLILVIVFITGVIQAIKQKDSK